MEMIQNSGRGLGLLVSLNWDRILYLATIILALNVGTLLKLL